MKKLSFILSLLLLLQIGLLNKAEAAPSCRILVNSISASDSISGLAPAAPVKPKLTSENYTEKLDLAVEVKNANGEVVGSSLKKALNKISVKALLAEQANNPHQILLRAQLPEAQGGGQIRLVTLDLARRNLAYNHVELAALLKVNPELANELGIYRVNGYENVAWLPDMKTLNYRLKSLANKYGYRDVKWNYAPADGVVSTLPYVQMLADGKFPFSKDADVNLSVHDGMHAVAFAVMNITPGGRKLLDVARTRNQIILKIYEKLSAFDNTIYAHNFLENYSKWLSPDALERTMLLTVLLTGNYDYFSAHNAVETNPEHRPYNIQNKEVTIKRIFELLKLFNNAQMNFSTVLDRLAPEGDSHRRSIQNIFTTEVASLKMMSDAELMNAAQQMVKFIPDYVLQNPDASGETRTSTHLGATAGPETLLSGP
ncbi:MAG: hypothetical protein ACXVAX_02595 [Pseudobdellovibrio sp.]